MCVLVVWHVRTWRSEVDVLLFSASPPLGFWDGLSLDPGLADYIRLVSCKPQESSCPHFQSLGIGTQVLRLVWQALHRWNHLPRSRDWWVLRGESKFVHKTDRPRAYTKQGDIKGPLGVSGTGSMRQKICEAQPDNVVVNDPVFYPCWTLSFGEEEEF